MGLVLWRQSGLFGQSAIQRGSSSASQPGIRSYSAYADVSACPRGQGGGWQRAGCGFGRGTIRPEPGHLLPVGAIPVGHPSRLVVVKPGDSPGAGRKFAPDRFRVSRRWSHTHIRQPRIAARLLPCPCMPDWLAWAQQQKPAGPEKSLDVDHECWAKLGN